MIPQEHVYIPAPGRFVTSSPIIRQQKVISTEDGSIAWTKNRSLGLYTPGGIPLDEKQSLKKTQLTLQFLDGILDLNSISIYF